MGLDPYSIARAKPAQIQFRSEQQFLEMLGLPSGQLRNRVPVRARQAKYLTGASVYRAAKDKTKDGWNNWLIPFLLFFITTVAFALYNIL